MNSEPTMPQYPPEEPSHPPSQPFAPSPSPSYLPLQRPGLRQRFARLPLFGKIGIGCGGCLALLIVSFIGLAFLGAIIGPPPASTSTPTTAV